MSALDMGAAPEDAGAEPSVEAVEPDPVLVDGADSTDDGHVCDEWCSTPIGVCVRRLVAENPDGMTLQEVGAVFGVTRERIRQIETIALGKLRAALREFDDHPPAEALEEPKPRKHRGKARAREAAAQMQVVEALEDAASLEDDYDEDDAAEDPS